MRDRKAGKEKEEEEEVTKGVLAFAFTSPV
jgi:hypothetical protein